MQHSIWHKIPIVRLLIAFSSGIGTAMFYSFNPWVVLSVIAFFLLAFLILPLVFKAYQQRWYAGIAAMIVFYCCGIFVHVFQNPLSSSSHFSYVPHAKNYVVMINEEPIEKANSFKMKTKVIQCTDTLGKLHLTTGNILLYISKKNVQQLPLYGDIIVLNAVHIREVSPPKNPFEFDYKRYLAFNHIHHQAYLQSGQLVTTNLNTGNAVLKQIYHIQHFFRQTLYTYVKTPTEVAVAQALLYGFDDNIDEATMSAYANTGTLHVLAVSGMHVGLIMVILNRLLFFMDKQKRLLLVKRIMIIICLWIYSALCGLSPSILRATVMFTFVIVAQILNRRSNIYNTLAASCLVLLCVDANMLANVGFQLSYMAVLGIVFLQPLIEKWYTARNWVDKQVWSIISVSLAAQLATCPIGILYFHQFPNFFLFSNLLIIPLTTGIIYITICLLICSWWDAASELIGYIIQQLIMFTDFLVMEVEQIPYSFVNGLQISIFQSILLYMLMLTIIFYFMYRYSILFKTGMAALLYFFIINGIAYHAQATQKKLVVYSISNSNVIHIINGKESVLYMDENIRNDKQKFRFHLQQHIWQQGLTKIDTLSNQTVWQHMNLIGKQVVLTGHNHCKTPEKVDVLIMRNYIPLQKITELKPQLIVISGKVKAEQAEKTREYCRINNIPVHDVMYSGAYQLSL